MLVVAQALVSRGVMLLQQLALAWLLAKSDFGLIGLAYTVTAFVTLMANPGLDAILVQRVRTHRRWANPAFWLGLTISILAAAATLLVAAPLAAWAYQQPRLIGLIGILAVALPIQSLQIVPKAQLQIELRFKTVVLLGTLSSVLTALLTVAAAWLGFGAYSFVVPVPIVAAVVGAATWWVARPPVRLEPELGRWWYLLGSSAVVFGINLLYTFTNQADYIALGLAGFADVAIGTYVFAYNIAIQPLRLLSSSVPVVLFPSLSHLSLDPEKQVRAALRAMRLLALIVVPFCLLQIVLAEPLFRLIFPPRWMDAVLLCQILTAGLMLNACCWPAYSLMMAQGRFRELLGITAVAALAFLAMLVGFVWIYPSIVSVAFAVGIWHSMNSPFLHWTATRHYAPWNSYLREVSAPVLAGLVAGAPCLVLQRALPVNVIGELVAIGTGGLVFSAVYLLMVYVFVPASLHDLFQQLAPLLDRLVRTNPSPTVDAASSDGSTP